MTSRETYEIHEFWDDEPALSAQLLNELKRLGDLATDLHIALHGPGGSWNTRGDLIA